MSRRATILGGTVAWQLDYKFTWELPKIQGMFLEVPRTRTIVFGGSKLGFPLFMETSTNNLQLSLLTVAPAMSLPLCWVLLLG